MSCDVGVLRLYAVLCAICLASFVGWLAVLARIVFGPGADIASFATLFGLWLLTMGTRKWALWIAVHQLGIEL